jgi:hypothetical protein
MNDPITFYVNLPLDELENLETALISYTHEDDKYLIAHEVSAVKKKSHFHVIAEIDNNQYEHFRNNILMKRYQLKAKAKQYGKVKQINDVNKMISYCLKDDGPRRTNLADEDVKDFLEKSFKKPQDRDHIECCIESLPPLEYKYSYTDTDILIKKVQILEYFKNNGLECNYNKINRIFDMFLLKQTHISSSQTYDIMRLVRQKTL